MTAKGDILIIDDDPDFCEIARVTLESASFSVRCASSSAQGLELMRREKPDLVFLDVIMVLPDEGVYVSEVMARDPELSDVPVVMVSSIADSDLAGFFPTDRPLHVHRFLDKPVQLQTLIEVANEFVKAPD